MKKTLFLMLALLSLSARAASGPDDVVIFNAAEFEEACGILSPEYGLYGSRMIIEKSYLESAEGKSLEERIMKCMEAYQSGNPGAAPGKPAALLDALKRHSVGQSAWGDIKLLDGGRLIAVTKDPVGGQGRKNWACIDYDGKTVIPFGRGVSDGDTDMDAIIFSKEVGKNASGNAIIKNGVMHNDGTIALDAKYDVVWLINKRWIIVSTTGNEGWAIYDTSYNLKLSGDFKKVEPFKFTYNNTDRVTNFFVITDSKDKRALFNGALRQITDFKFDGWMNEKPFWLGCEGDPLAYNYTCIIDTRTWEKLDKIPSEYWNHRQEEK